MTAPKHRRPTRTDRLLLWTKDRLTLRRRPQPVLETADFEEAAREDFGQMADWERRLLDGWDPLANEDRLDERAETYGPVMAYGPMPAKRWTEAEEEAWDLWVDQVYGWDLDQDEAVAEFLEELESIPVFVREWEKRL